MEPDAGMTARQAPRRTAVADGSAAEPASSRPSPLALLVIILGPTTGTRAQWHFEATTATPAAAMDNLALAVPPVDSGAATTVTNTARGTTVLWAPTASDDLSAAPVNGARRSPGTTISYATAPAGGCTAAPARWIVASPARRSRSRRLRRRRPAASLGPGQSAQLCLTVTPGDCPPRRLRRARR